MNENITFSRLMLKETLKEVQATLDFLHGEGKKKVAAENKVAWVIDTCGGWEFHYGDFYFFDRTDNAYDARVKGWEAWMSNVAHRAEKWLEARKTGNENPNQS